MAIKKGEGSIVMGIRTPGEGCRVLLLSVVLQAQKDLTAKSKITQKERQCAFDFFQNGAKAHIARLLGYSDDVFDGIMPLEVSQKE